jgi:hypothetical protein
MLKEVEALVISLAPSHSLLVLQLFQGLTTQILCSSLFQVVPFCGKHKLNHMKKQRPFCVIQPVEAAL